MATMNENKQTEPAVPKRRTKPRIQIDLDKVEQYAQVCDNEEEIALALGISYSTLQSRKRESAEFKSAIKKGRAKANVFVAGKLMDAVKQGNMTATIFYLKSRCGWRETNRTELTGAEGTPLNPGRVVIVKLPDNERGDRNITE